MRAHMRRTWATAPQLARDVSYVVGQIGGLGATLVVAIGGMPMFSNGYVAVAYFVGTFAAGGWVLRRVTDKLIEIEREEAAANAAVDVDAGGR